MSAHRTHSERLTLDIKRTQAQLTAECANPLGRRENILALRENISVLKMQLGSPAGTTPLFR